jgi:membrane-associated phospholipid phosphatase
MDIEQTVDKNEHLQTRYRNRPFSPLRSILWTVVMFAAWGLAVYSRSRAMRLTCLASVNACAPESVFYPDRFALAFNNPLADSLSFYGQYAVGVIALVIPWLIALINWRQKQGTFFRQLKIGGIDLLFLLKVCAFNGFINELMRLLIQRPRPFVYSDPLRLGENSAHYTSFYSGHTSFSVALSTAIILLLLNHNAPKRLVIPIGASLAGMSLLVALCRVFSGRHFPTDVIAASLAGFGAAILIGRTEFRNILGGDEKTPRKATPNEQP